jgi:tetratricopeptide (TPR) repeat protein
MSDTRVNGPGIFNKSIKSKTEWPYLFAFWALCGAAALSAVIAKTHHHWFARQAAYVDAAYGLKVLNFNMPDTYRELVQAIEEEKPVPDNYLTYYDAAAEFLPEDFAGHYLQGLCRLSKGQWEKAETSFRHAIEKNPYFFWAYYNLGVIYLRTGHPSQAMEIVRMAERLPPQLTLKSLTSTKLLLDCLKDPALAGHDPEAALRRGYSQIGGLSEGHLEPSLKAALF